VSDDDLSSLLLQLTPSARDAVRRVLIHDQADRDAVSSELLRYRDVRGAAWADLIDGSRSIRNSAEDASGCWASSLRRRKRSRRRSAGSSTTRLTTLGALRSTTSASKLHDAGCACCYDDHAAERGGDKQGDAKRELAVEDQERNGHFLQVLQDEDKHENQ
jgi:hypothetical protein